MANPTEIFLVADSLTGQVAVMLLKNLKNSRFDRIILTRVDGDGRGGAALSMKFARILLSNLWE